MKFGDVVVGTASAPQTLVVANAGDAPLTLGDFIGPSVGFSGVDGPKACTLGLVLAPAASCTALVTFEPVFAGQDVEELTIMSDGGNVDWFATGNGVLLVPVPALSRAMLVLLAACLGVLAAAGFGRQRRRDDRRRV